MSVDHETEKKKKLNPARLLRSLGVAVKRLPSIDDGPWARPFPSGVAEQTSTLETFCAQQQTAESERPCYNCYEICFQRLCHHGRFRRGPKIGSDMMGWLSPRSSSVTLTHTYSAGPCHAMPMQSHAAERRHSRAACCAPATAWGGGVAFNSRLGAPPPPPPPPFRFVPLAPRIDPLLNYSLLQIHCFCYWIWMDATGKGRCSAWSSTASACSVRRTTKNALASSHPENQGTTLFVRPLDHAASGHGTQFSLPLLLHEGIKKKGLLAYGQTPHMAIPFLDDDFCSACMVWFFG
jgi:hypothetical protein